MPSEARVGEGVPPLTTYYMYLTGGCNLACRHCWLAPSFQPGGGTGGHLDLGLYTRAIDEAIPLGLKRVKFTGGEPLLHPDFVAMVDYATEKGLGTWLETNGTLMTPELARHLKDKSSLFAVSVSLDGFSPETHDHMRNVPGSLEQARRGLRHLAEAGFRPQVIMSLFAGNVAEIEDLVRWAATSGCESVKFNVIQSSGRGAQMQERGALLGIAELVRLGRWIEGELQKRIEIPLLFSWPMAFHGLKRLNRGSAGNCGLLQILGVLSTGEMALCGIGTQEKGLVYGRLGRDSVAEVWASHPGLIHLRTAIPGGLEGVCGCCILKAQCLGACVAQNYHGTGRLTAPFWFCQAAEEAGLFPASRLRGSSAAKEGKLAV